VADDDPEPAEASVLMAAQREPSSSILAVASLPLTTSSRKRSAASASGVSGVVEFEPV
jgi:hypothetical protein